MPTTFFPVFLFVHNHGILQVLLLLDVLLIYVICEDISSILVHIASGLTNEALLWYSVIVLTSRIGIVVWVLHHRVIHSSTIWPGLYRLNIFSWLCLVDHLRTGAYNVCHIFPEMPLVRLGIVPV